MTYREMERHIQLAYLDGQKYARDQRNQELKTLRAELFRLKIELGKYEDFSQNILSLGKRLHEKKI